MNQHCLCGAVLALLLIGGCGKAADAPKTAARTVAVTRAVSAAQPLPTLFETMERVVVPTSKVLWDVSNTEQDDNGNFDASKVTDAEWKQIEHAATQMKAAAETLVSAAHVVVAPPGVAIQDQASSGSSSAQQVQGFIDADPAGFIERAKALAASGEAMSLAAVTRNASQFGDAVNQLDGVCEQCHVKFWYPQQIAPKK